MQYILYKKKVPLVFIVCYVKVYSTIGFFIFRLKVKHLGNNLFNTIMHPQLIVSIDNIWYQKKNNKVVLL